MNFIKTLNAKLTTTLFFTFAFLFSSPVLFGQFTLNMPSINGYVEDIDILVIGDFDDEGTYHDIEYEVDVKLDVDFGYHNTSEITELTFDIELTGFDSWSIDQEDLELNSEDVQITVSPYIDNPNLYTITTVFNAGASSTELSYLIERAITSTLVIDSRDDYAKTADCYDYHLTQTAAVEISNASFIMVAPFINSTRTMAIADSFYEDEFELPTCIGKGVMPNDGEFNINLMIKEVLETAVVVDLYVSFYNNLPISGGTIPFVYNKPDLEEPTVNWSENVDAILDNSPPLGAYIYLNNLDLDHTNEQQYLGTLTFDYKSVLPGTITTSGFYVFDHAELWDIDGNSLIGVTFDDNSNLPVLDHEEFHITHHSPKLENTYNKHINAKPNPAKDVLSIETDFANSDKLKASIYNINGQIMDNINAYTHGTSQFQIDVSHLPNGTYVLKLASDKTVAQSKFIIHR